MRLPVSAPDLMQRLSCLPSTPNVTLLDRRKPKTHPCSHDNTTFTQQIYIRWCCIDLSNAPDLSGTNNNSAILANMKSSILILIPFLLLGISAPSAEKNKPTISKTPLTAEEVEVYGTFLDSFVGKGKESVNFSDKTFPLTVLDSDNRGPCLEGIRLNNSTDASHSIHVFDASISSGRAINLVDEEKHKVKDPGEAIKHGQTVDSAVR